MVIKDIQLNGNGVLTGSHILGPVSNYSWLNSARVGLAVDDVAYGFGVCESPDTDGDGVPDYRDTDSDNDGNPDGNDPHRTVATTADDTGTGTVGVALVVDILANDDFLANNDSNNTGTTVITDTGSGTASGVVSFDASTGEMSYTPSAGEGGNTVSVVYEVCNSDVNPNVCETATVSIVVESKSIVASNDTLSVQAGNTGSVNVFANDFLSGTLVNSGTVSVNLTGTILTGASMSSDGVLSIPDNLGVGNYTQSYQICEIADPNNCSIASVDIVIASTPITICNRSNATNYNSVTGSHVTIDNSTCIYPTQSSSST